MMAARLRKWLERRTRERAERQWTRLSQRVERLGPASLRRLRDEALGLRASINRFLQGTDRRALQRFLHAWQPWLHWVRSQPQHKGVVRWLMDVDPLSL